MENTLYDKLKFIAQYWGQPVLTWGINTNYPINFQWMKIVHEAEPEYSFLELRSLAGITDEEAVEVAKIFYPYYAKDIEELCRLGKSIIAELNHDLGLGSSRWGQALQAIDYLRSIGVAVPFNGLSVQSIIDYGWVKINDTNTKT